MTCLDEPFHVIVHMGPPEPFPEMLSNREYSFVPQVIVRLSYQLQSFFVPRHKLVPPLSVFSP